jgi:hypothetical protein
MDMKVQGDRLVITLDIGKKAVDNAKPSKSQKTRIVATTGGFTGVEGKPGLRIALNLIASQARSP